MGAFPAKPQKNQKIPESNGIIHNNGKIVMQNLNSIKRPLEWLDAEAVEATTIAEVTIIVEVTAVAIKVAANIGAATKEAAVAVVVVTAGAVTIIQVATMVSTEGLLVMVITTEVDEDAEITVNVDSEPAVKVAEEIGEINERIR